MALAAVAAAETPASVSALLVSSGLTALVSVAASLLLARLIFHFVRRKELDAELQSSRDLQGERLTGELANKAAELEQTLRNELAVERARREMDREGRVRALLHAAAGPLFVATDELVARLDNVVDNTGYVQLDHDWDRKRPAAWTSTHAYFLSSTLYVLGRYFAQEVLLRERLGADEHGAGGEPLLNGLYKVSSALSQYPAPHNTSGCDGPDVQLFFWQQRAIGEVLVSRDASGVRVMSYADFLTKISAGEFAVHLEPLRALLVDLSPTPEGNCRWQRLQAVRAAFVGVRAETQSLLSAPAG